MTNKQTDVIAAILFSLAFLGTTIFAMTQQDHIAAFIGLILSLTFAIVALLSSKNI